MKLCLTSKQSLDIIIYSNKIILCLIIDIIISKSLNDRSWSPVAEMPTQENLMKLYLDNLVYYDEKAIENIVKSFYSGSFSN